MADFLQELENNIPALRRYANALLRDENLAGDLVQDCLERAIKKRRLWQPNSTLRPWLFTMMHNIYVNQVKKASNRPILVEIETEPVGFSGITHTRDIELAVSQLPSVQQQVLLLVALEGFSYKEVGKILKIPIGTVMSRLSRARETIRLYMEDEKTPQLRRVK